MLSVSYCSYRIIWSNALTIYHKAYLPQNHKDSLHLASVANLGCQVQQELDMKCSIMTAYLVLQVTPATLAGPSGSNTRP
eukprot:5576954-Amphidinium_carterae.1